MQREMWWLGGWGVGQLAEWSGEDRDDGSVVGTELCHLYWTTDIKLFP